MKSKIFEIIVAPSPVMRAMGEPARRFQILATTEAEAHKKALWSYARSVPKYLKPLAVANLGSSGPAGAGPAGPTAPNAAPEAPAACWYAVLECGDDCARRVISQAEVKNRNGLQCDVIGEWMTLEEATARASKSRV